MRGRGRRARRSGAARLAAGGATSGPRRSRRRAAGGLPGGGAARGSPCGGSRCWRKRASARDLVVGTSAGSLVAALYASGRSGRSCSRSRRRWTRPRSPTGRCRIFSRGMLRGEALARYVDAQVGDKLIEQMPMPLGIVATDLSTGAGRALPARRHRHRRPRFQRGARRVPARAHQRARLRRRRAGGSGAGALCEADGRRGRHRGGHLERPEGNTSSDPLQILLQTFAIMGKTINRWELQQADIVVRPALVGMGSADFASKRRAIEAGRAPCSACCRAAARQAHRGAGRSTASRRPRT